MSKEQELEKMLKLYSKKDLWNRIQEKQAMIYDLEAELAEKEKEIEKLKPIKIITAPINTPDLEKFKKCLNQEYFISVDTREPQIIVLNQNQKAIEQLEKIINLFEPYENENKDTILCANNGISFLEYIDQQIELLKGESK